MTARIFTFAVAVALIVSTAATVDARTPVSGNRSQTSTQSSSTNSQRQTPKAGTPSNSNRSASRPAASSSSSSSSRQAVNNGGRRPGNSGSPSSNSQATPPSNSSRNNGGYRPGNSGSPGGNNHATPPSNGSSTGRPSGNSGSRPGSSGTHIGNREGSARPSSPSSGGHPSPGSNYRPDNGYGHSHGHGTPPPPPSRRRPNPASNYRPGNYHAGVPVPPPYRPYRPAYRPYVRPVVPPTYVYYTNAPIINSILGMTFGWPFETSLNYLYNSGYYIDGYDASTIYLRDVREMSFDWDDALLSYNSYGQLYAAQFLTSQPYDARSRYYNLYTNLSAIYGSPISYGTGWDTSVTWFGGNTSAYVTLQYTREIINGYPRYYTILTYTYQ